MKWLYILLLLISVGATAQTNDSTRYIYYPTQYGMRMPRLWADSVLHIPLIDTAQLIKKDGTKARAGALVCRPQDKLIYRWDGDKWGLLSGGPSQNFVTNDLTLAVPLRNHYFGTNTMRFNYTGMGPNGDGYIGFNEINQPGISILSDGDALTPGGIFFKDAAAPSVDARLTVFYGGLTLRSGFSSSNEGVVSVGPGYVNLTASEVGNRVKEFALSPENPHKGIKVQDRMDTVGMWYTDDYSGKGISLYGDRWIPDAGWIRSRIPDDYSILTEEGGCTDTSFVNASGDLIGNYEQYSLPQFIGLRLRVIAGGLQLPADNRTAWYFTWNNTTGILRIYSMGTCEETGTPGQQRLFQGY